MRLHDSRASKSLLYRLGVPLMLLRCLFCLIISVTVVPSGHASDDVAVRLIYLASGKPAVKQSIILFEGKPSSVSTKYIHGTTDKNGIAHFLLSEPQPENVFVFHDNGQLASCAKEGLLSLAEISEKGITIGRANGYEATCKGSQRTIDQLSATPGEIVIFVRRLTVLDLLRMY